jgi:sulfur carrier protein ThiS
MAAEQIKVRVSGKGPLKKYITAQEVAVPRGSTVSMLVSRFSIPDGHRVICMRDGKRVPPSAKLHEGDSVIMISMISGG